MAFSDFVEQSLIAQPGWLAELENSRRGGRVAALCRWLQERLQASLTKRR
jgi:glutamate-ammonia-ligase adenylyltransferase